MESTKIGPVVSLTGLEIGPLENKIDVYFALDVTPDIAPYIATKLNGKVIEGEVIVKGVRFPKLNKNNTLATYRAEMINGYNTETVKVERFVVVSEAEWDKLTNNLMESARYEYLRDAEESEADGHYVGIGGSSLSDAKAKELGWEGREWDELMQGPDGEKNMKIYRANYRTSAVVVTNGESTIYLNCEGYDYARYLGL